MTSELTPYRTAVWVLPFLIVGGCATPDEPPKAPELTFCAAEEPRIFVPGEVEWRAANAPANLRRDIKTNTTGERECQWFEGGTAQ